MNDKYEMQGGALTVGTTPVQVPVTSRNLAEGVRVMGRAATKGKVFVGYSSAITTTNARMLNAGDWAENVPFTATNEHFRTGSLWLVASEANQVVDWDAA